MAYFVIIHDAVTLTFATISNLPHVVLHSDDSPNNCKRRKLQSRKFKVMPGKGRRAVAGISSSSITQVQVQLPVKTERKTKGCSNAIQNGSKISDFFKPSPIATSAVSPDFISNGNCVPMTPLKVNGGVVAPSSPSTSISNPMNGSAKKHIIQLTPDVDATEKRGVYTRSRKVPFVSALVKEESAAQLSPLKSESNVPRIDGDGGKLTDYFPIRRSGRLTRSRIIKKLHSDVKEALMSGSEDGLRIEQIMGKGRGVVAAKNFKRGEFVVEYAGELITMNQAKQREVIYAQDENNGCYMYYFLHQNRRHCVDATTESGRLGRLVNHSRSQSNLVTKTFVVDQEPRLILVAKRDIDQGEELLYDYGDRSKMSLEAHPWLAT